MTEILQKWCEMLLCSIPVYLLVHSSIVVRRGKCFPFVTPILVLCHIDFVKSFSTLILVDFYKKSLKKEVIVQKGELNYTNTPIFYFSEKPNGRKSKLYYRSNTVDY